MAKIYRYIIWISGEKDGPYMLHLTFFVYYSKKWKKYKSMTYTKIKILHHFVFKIGFLGWIIKNKKRRPPKFKKWRRGAGVDVTELKFAGWRPVILPTLCGQYSCLWGRRGFGDNDFFYPSLHNIFYTSNIGSS